MDASIPTTRTTQHSARVSPSPGTRDSETRHWLKSLETARLSSRRIRANLRSSQWRHAGSQSASQPRSHPHDAVQICTIAQDWFRLLYANQLQRDYRLPLWLGGESRRRGGGLDQRSVAREAAAALSPRFRRSRRFDRLARRSHHASQRCRHPQFFDSAPDQSQDAGGSRLHRPPSPSRVHHAEPQRDSVHDEPGRTELRIGLLSDRDRFRLRNLGQPLPEEHDSNKHR